MFVVLCGVQSPTNTGLILRTAEIYQGQVMVLDRFHVFENKTSVEKISDFACGAYQRKPPKFLDYLEQTRQSGVTRLIAANMSEESIDYNQFDWKPGDAVVVGNEYSGLSEDELSKCDAHVKIPMPPTYVPKPVSASPIDPRGIERIASFGAPSLNVAVAASILLADAYVTISKLHP